MDKNPIAAASIYNNLLDEVKRLSYHPRLGKVESFIDNSFITFRSLIVISGRFKVIYYVYNDIIYISQVWDCLKDPVLMRRK